MKRLVILLSGLALGAAWMSASPAWAQSASEIALAKQWFSEGMALEEKGQYAQALERFKSAAGVKKTPQILFHVGICELKTGALVEAIVSLERALELAKSEKNSQVESAATSELSALRPRVPVLEITWKGAAPTSVTLDGNALSPASIKAPIPVNPGSHELVAEYPGGKQTKSFQVAERDRAKLEIEAVAGEAPPATKPEPPPKPSEPPPAPAPPPAEPAPAPAATGGSIVPWLFIGGGVVATAGGFYMWKLRGDQIDSLDAICPTEDTCPAHRQGEVDDLESKGKTYSTLGIAFWGVGAAALATGGYLLLSTPSREKAAGTRVAPAVAPGFAGAALSGRF